MYFTNMLCLVHYNILAIVAIIVQDLRMLLLCVLVFTYNQHHIIWCGSGWK